MTQTIVETDFMSLELPPGGLLLSTGERLPEVTVAYEVYGELAKEGNNAVYVCHALTGNAHAAFYHSTEDAEPGWWDPLIGPGRAIDTDKYYVVCGNILGGCKGTTGPSSINPTTGEPYGTSFPLVTVADVVTVQKMLLDQLGVCQLYCVIGGSLGGMQVLAWSVMYAEYVRNCICIASATSLAPQALAFDIISRQEIESDPLWHDGTYYSAGSKPDHGLSRARQIGHVTYLSSAAMKLKFGRDEQSSPYPGQTSKFSTNFAVESYLNHQGRKFVQRFDANSYLYISRMMDMFDLAAGYGSTEAALKQTQSNFLICSISSDWLFPPSQQLEMVAGLLANRKRVSYFQIDSPYGHDAFLIEYEQLTPAIDAFLNGRFPDTPSDIVNLTDLEHISSMLDDAMNVLDVGSGDGSMMVALQQAKSVTGVCLDLEFDNIVACMRKGLPALQLDADTALSLIADDAFDCALMNQTIQQLHSALQAMKQLLRIAPKGIVGFPNFAYYEHRLSLMTRGKLPVSDTLPFEWYETPNIHLVTVCDFRELCRRNNITIESMEYISDSLLGKALNALGLVNIGCERGLVKISRNNEDRRKTTAS